MVARTGFGRPADLGTAALLAARSIFFGRSNSGLNPACAEKMCTFESTTGERLKQVEVVADVVTGAVSVVVEVVDSCSSYVQSARIAARCTAQKRRIGWAQ